MSSLRKFFGPSHVEVWKKVAEETGGQFSDGGFWGKKKVEVRVKEWTITLDTYTVSTGKSHITYTRLRAPYLNQGNFRFTLYRSNFFYEFAKKFGLQDIQIGEPEFDREFIIKSDNAEKIRVLLAYPKLRELISAQPRIHFQSKDDEGRFGTKFRPGVDELYFQAIGVIKDVERLKSLFTLFALTLNYLCQIGSAVEGDPQIELK